MEDGYSWGEHILDLTEEGDDEATGYYGRHRNEKKSSTHRKGIWEDDDDDAVIVDWGTEVEVVEEKKDKNKINACIKYDIFRFSLLWNHFSLFFISRLTFIFFNSVTKNLLK